MMITIQNNKNKYWLSSRSRELLACQKFMTILMGHKAACVAKQHMQLRKSAVDFSQLLTVDGEGCLNFSIFFVFLGLRIFTRIYCIWSETREQNLNDLLSYNGPHCLIISRFTYPNDLLITSNSLFFQEKGNPTPIYMCVYMIDPQRIIFPMGNPFLMSLGA